MPKYTVLYFDIRGLAEVARLVLAATGEEWKDERLAFKRLDDGTFEKPEWDAIKEQQPYHQAPVLILEDGTKIAQSGAIIRFLSSRHGLAGSSDVEAAHIDGGFEAVQDIRKNFFANRADTEKVKAFWESGLAKAVQLLNNNVQGSTFFGRSDKLSYTDVAIYYLRYVLATENKEAVEAAFTAAPKINALTAAVEKDERIAAYLAQRKQTPM